MLRPAMPWYTFRGPVVVTEDGSDDAIDEVPRLQSIDGLSWDDEPMADELEDVELEDCDIEGGTIELRWTGHELEVRTAYEAGVVLEWPQIDALRRHTFALWKGRLGEALSNDYAGKTGLRLDLAPDDSSTVDVDIED
ncbi:MAG: hypothetical protein H6719_37635 [Sandaracinaceae bacterium]|nr:hypothetical protein [Sandaracinaceae bacterium]